MMPLLIVGLEKLNLKRMGFQEMFCAQSANLKIQGPSRDLAPSHELPLPLFTTFPGRRVFSETGLSTLRSFSEVSGELLWVALCFRWD
jgi:hypothetical protein